jgi:L-asparaginase II
VNGAVPIAPGAELVRVVRGGRVESVHRGTCVVVRGSDVVHAWGDPERPIWCRSAVKPFQALPLLELGGPAAELTDAEVAVMSASHNGTPLHVEVVDRLLARGGLAREHLGCGPHPPLEREAAEALVRQGRDPERIHNNCSGKHAGFLLLARALSAPLGDYLDPASPPQVAARQAVADMAQVDPAGIEVAVDGCGAPTFRLTVVALARAFCRLANPAGLPAVRAAACGRLLRSITAEPGVLAGRGRLCTALIESAPGRVYPKNGAEGVYALGLPGRDLGVAIKVDDGSTRGYEAAVVEVLRGLGLWPEVPEPLRWFHARPVRNTRGDVVGAVEAAIEWPR